MNTLSDKENTKDLTEVDEDIEKETETVEEIDKTQDSTTENDDDEYEKVCYICRRPESRAGKMIDVTNGMNICVDCMQRSFDSMGSFGFSPTDFSGINMDDLSKMPNISMIISYYNSIVW